MQELLSGENYIITLFLSTKTSCALTCNKIIQPKSHLSRMKKIRELKKKRKKEDNLGPICFHFKYCFYRQNRK